MSDKINTALSKKSEKFDEIVRGTAFVFVNTGGHILLNGIHDKTMICYIMGPLFLSIPLFLNTASQIGLNRKLFESIQHQADRAVDTCIKSGADVDSLCPLDDKISGRNPLHMVAQGGYAGITIRLIADMLEKAGAEIDQPDENGKRPIDIALENHNRTLAQMLQKNCADVKSKTDPEFEAGKPK